jgi:hypothetical protein
MDEGVVDHMSISVWRCLDGFLYTISGRDESGEQLLLVSSEVKHTRRPLHTLAPIDQAAQIIYEIATDGAQESRRT